MGSTNFTTHYDIPLPLGSDKTTPMDYNESMQTVDTALFEAHGNASSAIAGLEITNGNVAQNAEDIDALEGRMTTAEGTLVTQGNAINNLNLEVADVRADGQDMICAYKEASAQSTHNYVAGDYFIYNDVLYKATETINAGDTIVPDTNCTTTNVVTEIKTVKSDLEWKIIADIGQTGNVTVEDISNFKEFQISGIKGTANVLSATFLGASFRARQTTLSFYNGTDLTLFNVSVTDSTTLSVGAFDNINEVVIRAR